jgi:hypothetical protein
VDARLLNTFLYFGYLPVTDPSPFPFDVPPEIEERDPSASSDVQRLVDQGRAAFNAVFDDLVSRGTGRDTHVVPLSGGLDSRAILGGLLDRLDASRIHTATVGVPGTLDFEIGRTVARAFGVSHEAIDLSGVPWDHGGLLRFAQACGRWVPLFQPYLLHQVRASFGGDATYWSGFMGDPLSGSHLGPSDSPEWTEAVARFVGRNRSSLSVRLAPPGFQPESTLPTAPLADPRTLSYDEQLDFALRQQCYVRPVVLLPGFEYETPFLHPAWVSYALRLPRRYRVSQLLYKEILKQTYPRLFSLPTKTCFGLPLGASAWRVRWHRNVLGARKAVRRVFPAGARSVHPMANYLDFDRALREREDLKSVVRDSIQALKRRGVINWIDVSEIWNQHQRGAANHAGALLLLASLEIILQAREGAPATAERTGSLCG